MDNIQTLTEMVSPLEMAEKLLEAVRDMEAQMALQRQRINELEQEMTALKNDPWTSRVTYENVVEMIALNEDSAVRDEMRKVFEPLLKKAQVQQLRRDIKCKVKELDGDEGGREIHNHFEAGSTPQVFNGKVSGATFNPSQRS